MELNSLWSKNKKKKRTPAGERGTSRAIIVSGRRPCNVNVVTFFPPFLQLRGFVVVVVRNQVKNGAAVP